MKHADDPLDVKIFEHEKDCNDTIFVIGSFQDLSDTS
jgi:hypothetical protein